MFALLLVAGICSSAGGCCVNMKLLHAVMQCCCSAAAMIVIVSSSHHQNVTITLLSAAITADTADVVHFLPSLDPLDVLLNAQDFRS